MSEETLFLDKKLIDYLTPRHGRTSCSDSDPNNHGHHWEGDRSRCDRCQLMYYMSFDLPIHKDELNWITSNSTDVFELIKALYPGDI